MHLRRYTSRALRTARKLAFGAVLVAGLMSCNDKKEYGFKHELPSPSIIDDKPKQKRTAGPMPGPKRSKPVGSAGPSAKKPEEKKDEMVLIKFEGKTFKMDGREHEGTNFYIDKYEAHVVELINGKEVRHPHNHALCLIPKYFKKKPPKGYYKRVLREQWCKDKEQRIMARSKKEVLPQAHFTRKQAMRACVNAGERLCTRAEMVLACKGKRGFKYPYGNEPKSYKCNLQQRHRLGEFFGDNPNDWDDEDFNDPRINVAGFLTPGGDHPFCKSDFGVYDLVGNLQEWVSDLSPDGHNTFVGGNYSNSYVLANEMAKGSGCEYVIEAHGVDIHNDYATGFRCCKDFVSGGQGR